MLIYSSFLNLCFIKQKINKKTACPKDSQIGCLNFNNTILLYLVDEPNSTIPQTVAIFEQAMLAKIESGWLVDNFDLDEALKPPPTKRPTTSPTDTPSVSVVPTMAPTVSVAPTSHVSNNDVCALSFLVAISHPHPNNNVCSLFF